MVEFSYLLLLQRAVILDSAAGSLFKYPSCLSSSSFYSPAASSRFFDILMEEIYNLCYLFTHRSLWQAEYRNCRLKYLYRRREQFIASAFALRCFAEWINPLIAGDWTDSAKHDAECRVKVFPHTWICVRWHRRTLWLFKKVHSLCERSLSFFQK